MKSRAERHQPVCVVSHEMISKFSAIIGNCDLITEAADRSMQAKRLSVIREIAETAVKALVEHQRQVEAEFERTDKSKAS
jgi:hypothetical protein